jgi:hypothetical protein
VIRVIGAHHDPTVIIETPTGEQLPWVARLVEEIPEVTGYVWPSTDRRLPARGDNVEAWLKRARDAYSPYGKEGDYFRLLDDLLDDYRLHADTGTPLAEHACEGSYCCGDGVR